MRMRRLLLQGLVVLIAGAGFVVSSPRPSTAMVPHSCIQSCCFCVEQTTCAEFGTDSWKCFAPCGTNFHYVTCDDGDQDCPAGAALVECSIF